MVDVLDNVICNSMCCQSVVCKLGWPSAIDPVCRQKGMCICIDVDGEACIPILMDDIKDKRDFDTNIHKCVLARGHQTCIVPPFLKGGAVCKGINKCLCLETRFACPCDEEVPCMFGICFVTCVEGHPKPFKFMPEGSKGPGLLVRAPTMTEKSSYAAGGAPAVGGEMERS